MARVIDAHPNPNGVARYPWDQWLDGQVWQLRREVDFAVSVNSFRSSVYSAAQSRGLRTLVSVSHSDGTVTVQAVAA